jgi:hypothetical protein
LHAAALLIDQDRGMSPDNVAKMVRQRLHLRRSIDVALEEDEAPWIALAKERDLVGCEHQPAAAADECADRHRAADAASCRRTRQSFSPAAIRSLHSFVAAFLSAIGPTPRR